MMERSEKDSCKFQDYAYSHDSELCTDEKCMICKNGEWEETSDRFPANAMKMEGV